MPAGSSPKIAGSLGSGRCGNHLVQLASTLPRLGTMPQALTSTNTSVEPGFGTAIVSIDIGAPTAPRRRGTPWPCRLPPPTSPACVGAVPQPRDRAIDLLERETSAPGRTKTFGGIGSMSGLLP